MRLKLLPLVAILLLTGSTESRPQRAARISASGWRPVSPRSAERSEIVLVDSRTEAVETERKIKDFKDIDLSLRTVATQLLNVTGPDDFVSLNEKQPAQSNLKLITYTNNNKKVESSLPDTKDATKKTESSKEKEKIETEIVDKSGMVYGRPINSKFAYFGSSHPGEAMAMTEEELEKEMSLTKVTTIQKGHTTTTGGISTWILLNPPSTTVKNVDDTQNAVQVKEEKVETTTKPVSSTLRQETPSTIEQTSASTIKKVVPVQTTPIFEKISTESPKKSNTTNNRKITVSPPQTQKPQKPSLPEKKPVKVEQRIQTTITKSTTPVSTTPVPKKKEESPVTTKSTTTTTTKKTVPANRTTAKVRITTSRPSAVTTSTSTTKVNRPEHQTSRPKAPLRKSTSKPDTNKTELHYTSKIERVTLKPVQTVNIEKIQVASSEQPVFITKLKASVNTETKKPVTYSNTRVSNSTKHSESNETSTKPKPNSSNKGNNILKVQLKKPVDDLTKIEIEPIKVNAPVLKIEKVEQDSQKVSQNDEELLGNTKIDLKFDFNPDLKKVEVETTSAQTTSSTTTKRPRQSSKRKKTKIRRRKPSSTTTVIPVAVSTTEIVPADNSNAENSIQESKIEPETKVAATNSTKTKKKTTPNPISTQIYNFLSREVMPSFGVMSLVGLGLGLASYFLYPFSGSIARRNYVVEPNYKYNLDEYGGHYGQNEEEVLAKVLEGMTNHDKNFNSNYYQYQNRDGVYADTTRKSDVRYTTVAGTKYRPVDNTGYGISYRNTEFKYPDVPTTPNYYERQKKVSYPADTVSNSNRQFVVGSVPKDYTYEKAPISPESNINSGGSTKKHFEPLQAYDYTKSSVPQVYENIEKTTSKPDDPYEEYVITPTAVAVEHGPRGIKVKRSLNDKWIFTRDRRDSVIQVIPPKHGTQKEGKEDLSNEIMDIIDSAIPENLSGEKVKNDKTEYEFSVHKSQKKRQEEQKYSATKQSDVTLKFDKDTTMTTAETTESLDEADESHQTNNAQSTTTSFTTSTDKNREATTEPPAKDMEETTLDWFHDIDTTTEKSKPQEPSEGFSLFNFVRKIAEVKFKLGITLLKHASEGFAKYLGRVQKRINGEE